MRFALFFTCLLVIPQLSQALEPDEVRDLLVSAVPGLVIDSINKGSIDGFYTVALIDGSEIQITQDGKYFVYGDLVEIRGGRMLNRSDIRRKGRRQVLLDLVPDDDMIVFSPRAGEIKATITVFTDIDCTFCRRLHQEVPELNRLGVAVQYLAFPRTGVGATVPSYKKLVSAWCSDNRQLALTQAKAGQALEPKVCENPVAKHYALGELLGVTGTPAILYEDGRLETGYRTAVQLARELKLN